MIGGVLIGGRAVLDVASRRGWLALVMLLELVVLREITEGRFLLLLRGGEAVEPLWYLHTGTKVTLLAALTLLIAAAVERRLSGPPLLARAAFVPVLALHGVVLVALLALIPGLPSGYSPGLEAEAALWRYAAVSVAFLAWQASALALIAPRAALHGIGWRAGLFVLCGIVSALILSAGSNLVFDAVRGMVEGSTLSMSLAFHDLIGRVEPVIDYSGEAPVMSARGFAILIGESCAGYQGMLAAALLMAGLITLEWSALRPWRALALGLATVAAVFTLNALRIALLFHIGVTYSPEMAVEGFHSYFGTLSLLAVVALAMLALQHPFFRMGSVSARALPAGPRMEPQESAAAGLIVPLAIYLGIGMVLGLFTTGFNWIYPVSVVAGLALMVVWRQVIAREFASGAGLSGVATGVAMGVAIYGLWMALVPADAEADRVFAAELGSVPVSLAAGWMLMRLIGFSVVVPVLEELAFRGGLYRLVSGWVAPVAGPRAAALAAFVLTSLAFGAMHSDMLAGTLAGAGFALLVLRTGRVGDAIIAHAVTNFMLAVTAMVTGHWSLW